MSEFVKKLHDTNLIIDSYSSNVLGGKKQESSYLSAFYRAFYDNFSKQNIKMKYKPPENLVLVSEKNNLKFIDKTEIFENKFFLIYQIIEAE